MSTGLSKKQLELLHYLKKYIKKHNEAPTLKEIASKFDITISAAQLRLRTLMLKGYILKKPNKPRSISIKNEVESKSVTLPVLGVISAGEGISVFQETNPELIEVPSTMVNTDVAHYCLRVKGNSMIEDGILDGDSVVVRQQKTADNGDAVVAIINDDEEKANLKRFYLRGKIVELRPRNKQLKSKYYPAEKIEIRGKFCGLIRS